MKTAAATAIALLGAGPALAHTGHGAEGLAAGLLHLLLGADHLLAMLAVGLWSGFVLRQRVWAGAAAFLLAMTAGAGLAWGGIGLPLVEPAILASVVLFGALTAVSRRGQAPGLTQATLAAVAAFALFHGHAHGTEAAGGHGAYLGGMLAATAALHLAGLGLARFMGGQPRAQTAAGLAVLAGGAALALG